jgi:hypothetical protein
MSQLFSEQATLRASELGVTEHVRFIHADATGYIAEEKFDIAACIGATWIAGGVAGTVKQLEQSLKSGGICSSANRTGVRYPQRRRSLSLAARLSD